MAGQLPLWETIAIALVTGAVGGAIGLALPWVKWAVEKRRAEMNYRRQRISEWRRRVGSASSFDEVRVAVFEELRPYMDAKQVERFSTVWIVVGDKDGDRAKLSALSRAIGEVERKWKLI